jgi:thiamine kinase-like enzyme
MYLDLNNVLYYLYDYGYINESDLFNERFDIHNLSSLNSVFKVEFNRTMIIVKQAYNTGKQKEIALKKDAFFMNELYQVRFLPNNKGNELIDETRLIYTRKGIFSNINIYESIKNNAFNEWEKLLDRINEIHKKINEQGFISQFVGGISPEDNSLIFAKKIPLYIPTQSVEYSNIQKFWRKVSPEIIDLINPKRDMSISGKYIDSDKIVFNKNKTLIHGDLSLSNILYDDKGNNEFYVIDWEMCQCGDTMWDYATLYAEKVRFNQEKPPEFFRNIETYVDEKFKDRVKDFKLFAILAQIKRLQQLLNLNSLNLDDALSRLHLLNQEFKLLSHGQLS